MLIYSSQSMSSLHEVHTEQLSVLYSVGVQRMACGRMARCRRNQNDANESFGTTEHINIILNKYMIHVRTEYCQPTRQHERRNG